MAKVNAIASPVITDESTLSGSEIYPNVIHIEGVAEIPDIEVCSAIYVVKVLPPNKIITHLNVYLSFFSRLRNHMCHFIVMGLLKATHR